MASKKATTNDLHHLHEDDDELFLSSSSDDDDEEEEEEEEEVQINEELEEEQEEVEGGSSKLTRRPSRTQRRVVGREIWVDQPWQMRWSGSPLDVGCRRLVRPGGSFGRRHVAMDVDEVRACRDLGLEFPPDWSLELSPSSSSSSPCSPGTSPASTLRISNPGDDPRDVKERLKVWAHAVALASASFSRFLATRKGIRREKKGKENPFSSVFDVFHFVIPWLMWVKNGNLLPFFLLLSLFNAS